MHGRLTGKLERRAAPLVLITDVGPRTHLGPDGLPRGDNEAQAERARQLLGSECDRILARVLAGLTCRLVGDVVNELDGGLRLTRKQDGREIALMRHFAKYLVRTIQRTDHLVG